MPANHYRFVTRWLVEGTAAEAYRILEDTAGLVRWWPTVWLRVEIVEPGDAQGVGQVARMASRGWLPYVLHWTSRAVEKVFPTRMVLEASGDFEGRGVWTLRQVGEQVEIEYLWEIVAEKPLLRRLSFLLKPAFAANHRWAMARGEVSLRRELARQRASPTRA